MKRFLFLIFTISLFSSCYTTLYVADYKMNLKEVKTKKALNKATNNTFEDSLFSISWKFDTLSMTMNVSNKSDKKLTFNFEEAYLTYPNGDRSDLIRTEKKCLDKEFASAPITILKNKSFSEKIYPEKNIIWITDSTYYCKEKSFIKSSWGMEFSDAESEAENNVNKKIFITIPVTINNKKRYDYTYSFNVSSYNIKTIRAYNEQSTYGVSAMGIGLVCFALYILVFSL